MSPSVGTYGNGVGEQGIYENQTLIRLSICY